MEFKYKIIIAILIIVIISSCKKIVCEEDKGNNVLPFPIGYENYFSELSLSQRNLKSNNGLTDAVRFYSNTNSSIGYSHNLDPISC